MKTSELIGLALNWAVCLALGNKPVLNPIRFGGVSYGPFESELGYAIKNYQHDWAQSGPIIEQENISTNPTPIGSWCEEKWMATDSTGFITEYGNTLLIAAMRCYVASKLGDEVAIPEELK